MLGKRKRGRPKKENSRIKCHTVKCNDEDEKILKGIYLYTFENTAQIFRSAIREYYRILKERHSY